jgi:hypothetical protein
VLAEMCENDLAVSIQIRKELAKFNANIFISDSYILGMKILFVFMYYPKFPKLEIVDIEVTSNEKFIIFQV